jgi:hypothetical protein
MIMLSEVIVPLTEDITQEGTLGLNIVRGLEAALATAHDLPFAAGEEFLEGEWGKIVDGKLEAVVGAVAATDMLYPVWCGSGDRYDAVITGQVTVLTGTGFIYKTNRFNTGASYAVGTPLTVKNGKVPTPASAGEPVIGRVFEPVTGGVLTIQVAREGVL